jgi:hypothetical protein
MNLKCLLIAVLLNAVSSDSCSDESAPGNVCYDFSLWAGSDVRKVGFIKLCSPANTTFFDAMTQAALEDPSFKFEYKTFSIGRYITKIGNNAENPAE